MRSYFTALAKAGYNVTVLDTSNAKLKQYGCNIVVEQAYVPVEQAGRVEAITRFLTKTYNGFSLSGAQKNGNDNMLDIIDQRWETLYRVIHTSYDLVVIDDIPCVHCSVIASALNKMHNTKIILFSTTKPLEYNFILLGLVKSPVTNPYIFTFMPKINIDIMDFKNIKHRIHNLKLWFYEMYEFLTTDESRVVSSHKEFGQTAFSWTSLFQNIGLHVVESVDENVWPVPTHNFIKHTGLTCNPSSSNSTKPIPRDLLQFMEDTTSKGTIYIAFGSYIDFTYAPEHLHYALVNGIQRLSDYRVIVSVKINNTYIPKLPFVRYVDWAPQKEILQHYSTKVFLTHGGLKSIKEAICSKVSIVIMPLFAEQSANAHMILKSKIGRILNKFTVDEKTFATELKTVASATDYKNNIKNLYELWSERPMSHLEQVVFMTKRYDKVDSKSWNKYLQPQSKRLPTYCTYLVDVIGVVLIFIAVVSY
ncbi:unnamed protein product [Bursaphelenchus okinawaensis]|uniref:glucuronosyltransferase n=1 Tax=Bursaphelenchus okinawaensis TaxID=465554 RepID=A0A811LM10_9BILA|nr:unnamed protein product [Bursaphelenchus okinawaensis]CAG9124932.1 unnamed protein product [Bursaphelenchus okinawaensis]